MAARLAQEALTDTPVILITGPRQCGKTTLAKQLVPNHRYITLDSPVALGFAHSNPAEFVASLPPQVVLDEVQRAPQIFLPLKQRVDENRVPGGVILTGSSNVLLRPDVADSLAGRMEVIDLWPLSQSEVQGKPTRNFIDDLLASDFENLIAEPFNASLLTSGGFPEARVRSAPRREAWFQSYLRTILDRDVRDLSNIEGLSQLPRLLQLLANQAGEPLNISALERQTGIAHTSLTRYIDLLKAVCLIHLVRAWSWEETVKLARTPKAFVVDSALAAHLTGIQASAAPLLATFVAHELAKHCATSVAGGRLFHFRSIKNREVPFVVQTRAGHVLAIDFSNDSALGTDANLRIEYLQNLVETRFYKGVLLYPGTHIQAIGPQSWAVPLSLL
jgi:hypothetical protein